MKCGRCGARVIWTRTATKNEWMPVDQERVSEGVRFRLHAQASGPPLSEATPYGEGHRSHFATCPEAERAKSDKLEDAGQGRLFD